MVSLIYLILLIIILVYFLSIKEKNINEHFIDGNFTLCRPTDCSCLKLNRAPDGSCVKYKIAQYDGIAENVYGDDGVEEGYNQQRAFGEVTGGDGDEVEQIGFCKSTFQPFGNFASEFGHGKRINLS